MGDVDESELEIMVKGKSDSDVILHTDDFFLRPWEIEDAVWYVESRDEEVFKWTKEKRDVTIEETEEAIKMSRSNPDTIGFAIVDSKTMEKLGSIALAFREKKRDSAEVMYWLAPWGRGRGIAMNSVKIVCEWAFDSLGLARITLKTHPQNMRSQLVAERAGFVRMERGSESQPCANGLWFELRDDE